jgi:hypothetical protein
MFILFLFVQLIFAQDELTPEEIQQRYSSTLKDSWVEEKLAKTPKIKDCIDKNKITKADLANDGAKTKRDAALLCFKNIKDQLSDDDLKNLEKSLGAGDLKITEGKDSKKMLDYLSIRLEKALYGVDQSLYEGIKDKGAKDLKIVDQKVFVDLIEIQLGKNIITEISRYCYRDLTVNKNSTLSYKIDKIKKAYDPKNPSNLTITDFEDYINDSDPNKNESKGLDDLYSQNVKQLEGVPFIAACTEIMKGLCNLYTADTAIKPANGQKSCMVLSNLRQYQKNLKLIQSDGYKKLWANMQGGHSFGQITTAGNYDGNKKGESLDDLTALTSKDVENVYGKDQDKLAEEINNLGCNATPEKAECEKYFYNESESLVVENAKTKNELAILFEKKVIDKIKKKEDLNAYLEKKGYLDLIEKYKNQDVSQNILDEVSKRIEAEKKASFEELAQSFERKQIKKGALDNKAKVDNHIAEIKNKKNNLGELVAFNNIVMSYLDICTKPKTNPDGSTGCDGNNSSRFVSAGQREIDGRTSEGLTGQTELYFKNYASDLKGKQGSDGKPEGFLNMIEQLLK